MPTLWFDSTDFVTGDPTLRISYPSVTQATTIVTATAVGDLKWISLGAVLPFPARIDTVVVCYQILSAATPPTSVIRQTRLSTTTSPDKSIVLSDDGTVLDSKAPVCYRGKAGTKVPAGALEIELRLHFQDIKDQIVLGGIALQVTELCANHRGLGEFGDYTAGIAQAETVFDQALQAMILQGGGVLCIPRDAPAGFFPRNRRQDGVDQPAVTVVDCRDGFERLYVPPIGTLGSSGTTRASHVIEHDLANDLGWQGEYSTELIQSRYRGGASSYLQSLTRAVPAGTAVKNFYVPTSRGLFKGQQLSVTGVANGYGGPTELVTIQGLGSDANGPFFTASSTLAHPLGAFAYNKNVINGLTVEDVANCDNQSTSLAVERTVYGLGDSFVVTGLLTYQGDILSAGGDEGGVGIASQIEHDLDCFWGEVESWNAATGELVYKDATAANPQKLGTSRPLINISQATSKGQVLVMAPGAGPSHIIGRGVDWDASTVGKFIAIDEPTELYAAGEANALGPGTGKPVHRWWHITAVEPRGDRTIDLYVERTVWFTNRRSGPTLFRFDNYSTPGAEKELAYLIAPGAWVSDVRRAVAGDLVGALGQAKPEDARTLVLAPSGSSGAATDFAPGDTITNAVGPDPWQPTGFRARHFDSFPSAMPGTSYLSENYGKVQLGSALAVLGPTDPAQQKDAQYPFDAPIFILAGSTTAIRIRGPVEKAALDLWQPAGNPHKIRWLVQDGGSAATLHADPSDGTFRFAGGDLDFDQKSSRNQQGLSGDAKGANNLRGIDLPVGAGAARLQVTFRTSEPDAAYALFVQCSWPTLTVVTKTAAGFAAAFSPAAPAVGGTLDWLLVR
ncbi:MAG TPA: hypothetical protein VH988_01160 [Thermoanaerobaculia bacterium]|jgi:hypothetical protein|nr:hypothetical protein [Thermoanaerobaculia bacterium]